MAELQTLTLPAGTVCHRNGLPFVLQHATQVECHPGNWQAISAGVQAEVPPVCRACAQYTSLPATKVRVEDLLKSAGYSRAEPAAPPAGLFSTLAAWLMQLRFRLLTRGRK